MRLHWFWSTNPQKVRLALEELGLDYDLAPVDLATGAKVVSDDVCVGCKVCTIACPFGTVNYNQTTGKVIKCDLCGGDPECVKICPTDAIAFVEAGSTGFDKMRAWAAKTDAGAQAEA